MQRDILGGTILIVALAGMVAAFVKNDAALFLTSCLFAFVAAFPRIISSR